MSSSKSTYNHANFMLDPKRDKNLPFMDCPYCSTSDPWCSITHCTECRYEVSSCKCKPEPKPEPNPEPKLDLKSIVSKIDIHNFLTSHGCRIDIKDIPDYLVNFFNREGDEGRLKRIIFSYPDPRYTQYGQVILTRNEYGQTIDVTFVR